MGKQQVKYFVVDAFTDSPFKGNPAAVCLLEEDKDDKWLQAVAAEFNISETCFLIPSLSVNSNPRFHLRWFTPVAEVKLCGHATLAAAHTLFSNGLVHSNVIEFETLSGILTAKKVPGKTGTETKVSSMQSSIELDFPCIATSDFNSADVVASISKALNGASIIDVRRNTTSTDNIIVVLASAKEVTEILPRFDEMDKCPGGAGIIVTALAPPDSGFDFYSRYFCPKLGIKEDPVCGSAHCALAPYWGKELGKCELLAYQASPRSGILDIHVDEATQRVLLRGKAFTVMEGHLFV